MPVVVDASIAPAPTSKEAHPRAVALAGWVIITLARRHRLPVYDAACLEGALREGLELATLDTALAVAARQEEAPASGAAG